MPFELLRTFVRVIDGEITGVLRAWRTLTGASDANQVWIKQQAKDPDPFRISNADDIWLNQNRGLVTDGSLLMITHSAALSRVLFPISPRRIMGESKESHAKRSADRDARGRQLRAWLEVADDSVLNEQGRMVRNTVEHWDERLEDWFAQATAQGHPHPTIEHSRIFDDVTRTVTWGRDSLELGALVDDVIRLQGELALAKADLGIGNDW